MAVNINHNPQTIHFYVELEGVKLDHELEQDLFTTCCEIRVSRVVESNFKPQLEDF